MNEKEVAEIRRRLRPEKNSITHVRGCYVNENREIISEFDQSLALMSEADAEKILNTLRRTLSGTLDKNLINISFTTEQVVDSPEHKRLMALRSTALKEETPIKELFEQVIASVTLESSYLILLAQDSYDVPYRSGDDEIQPDAASEVYSYILCGICPIKQTKPALSYLVKENAFHSLRTDWIVAPPELGFLFPAFDDRAANLYGSLYYTRNTAEHQEEFVQSIFGAALPMPAEVQKETFQAMLEGTLAEDCSLEVVQAVHEELNGMIEAHKESKETEPLYINQDRMGRVLRSCGVSDGHVSAFEMRFTEEFGEDAALSPRNVTQAKTQLKTPNVTIQVSPEGNDLLQTRVIGGVKYILIRADDGVEVNGVGVTIS